MATAESVKAKIQGLIDTANDTTGNADKDLTAAVGALVAGYGAGGGSEEGFNLTPYIKTINISADFSEVTKPVELHLETATSLSQMFYNVYLHCPKITIYISNLCTNMSQAFRFGAAEAISTMEEIEIVGDTSNITSYNQMFTNRRCIKRILGEFDFSECTNTVAMFNGAINLQEFYPVANTIKKSISLSSAYLIDASIQAIIDGLADMTDTDTQTLTFHADVKAKLTDTQIATITNKNWTLA